MPFSPAALRILFVLLPVAAVAGSSAAELRLEITDPSGIPMHATGTLESVATGAVESFETDAHGRYTSPNVVPGRYRVQVSAPGFATQTLMLEVESAAPVARRIALTLSAPAFQIQVVGTTPLSGSDHTLDEIPAPVQAATDRDVEHIGALDLSDFMSRRLNGVYLNAIQGNPLQADVNYRGFTASPLPGTSQGLSVYLDGVRLNQPFGDIVAWDLIPRVAVSEVTLIPGSNPLFGLNTLGGALSIETKDGRTNPGTTL
jgi:outer membrane receptor protein involved in Fe transport